MFGIFLKFRERKLKTIVQSLRYFLLGSLELRDPIQLSGVTKNRAYQPGGVAVSESALPKVWELAWDHTAQVPLSLGSAWIPIPSFPLTTPPPQEEVKNVTPQSEVLNFNGGRCIFNRA